MALRADPGLDRRRLPCGGRAAGDVALGDENIDSVELYRRRSGGWRGRIDPAREIRGKTASDDRDFQDAIALGVECGVSTVDGLKDIVRRFFGEEQLPLAAELRFRDLAKAIDIKLKVGGR